MRTIPYIVLFVFLFCLSRNVLSDDSGAKAIFHTGEGPTVIASNSEVESNAGKKSEIVKTEKYMGISYWIDLLESNGKLTRVSPTKTFSTGDRIKLIIESNRNGYLYVLNIGSSGNSHVLFPNPGVKSNLITAGLPYAIPFKTYMRFDSTPGEETLLIMLSPRPVENFGPSTPASGPLDNQQTNQVIQMAQAIGAKDIILENDSLGPAPATYAVAPVSSLESKAITLQVKLMHK